MAELQISPDSVVVVLSPAERVAALHGDVAVERACVAGVEATADGAGLVTGMRAPGLSVPGGVKLGTWRHDGVKDFVAVRPGRPAVAVRLTGAEWDRLIVSVDDPDAVVARLETAPLS